MEAVGVLRGWRWGEVDIMFVGNGIKHGVVIKAEQFCYVS